jgi:hypothetical protein
MICKRRGGPAIMDQEGEAAGPPLSHESTKRGDGFGDDHLQSLIERSRVNSALKAVSEPV